jgi:hypothetical protein
MDGGLKMSNDLVVVSKERSLFEPYQLVKTLAQDKMQYVQDDADEQHLLALLKEYTRVGANNMKKETAMRLAGHRLAKKGLSLLKAVNDSEGRKILYKVTSAGMTELNFGNNWQHSSSTRWNIKSLKDTKIEVPLEILQKLPEGSAKKLMVFSDYGVVPDPIIAVPVGSKMFDWIPRNFYIGIVKW